MDIGKVYGTFVDIYLKPTKTFKKLKKADISDSLIAVVLGALVPAVIGALIILLFGAATGTLANVFAPGAGLIGAGVGAIAAVSFIILYPIMAVISWLIIGVIIWIVATVIGGGKREPIDLLAPFGYMYGALLVLCWIPIVSIVVLLYSLYLLYVMLQPTMKMNSDKAALTVVVLIIVCLVLTTLVGAALVAISAGTSGGTGIFGQWPGLGA